MGRASGPDHAGRLPARTASRSCFPTDEGRKGRDQGGGDEAFEENGRRGPQGQAWSVPVKRNPESLRSAATAETDENRARAAGFPEGPGHAQDAEGNHDQAGQTRNRYDM